MNQTIVGQVREEIAGLKSALLEPGMPEVADHIFSLEKAAGHLLTFERPENPEERAAMRTELEMLRNELKRVDDLSRTGEDFCREWGQTLGVGGDYTADGTPSEIDAVGSIVLRG